MLISPGCRKKYILQKLQKDVIFKWTDLWLSILDILTLNKQLFIY